MAQGCKECLSPSPKACEGAELKCTAAKAACMESKMKVPVGALRWLSFWDENNYNPAEFRGWATFGFTAGSSGGEGGGRALGTGCWERVIASLPYSCARTCDRPLVLCVMPFSVDFLFLFLRSFTGCFFFATAAGGNAASSLHVYTSC